MCSALAAVARRLCSTPVHPDGLFAFVACRLIPLNKNPGVRPIGIGEVPRRIIAKAILKVVENDVQSAAGPLQTCAGHEAGVEAAVHAMKTIHFNECNEGLLLVDASNAFNSLNRIAALHNIQQTCPSIWCILQNTYQAAIPLFVKGEGTIWSSEGTTQGDPLAMAMYALGITPLISRLQELLPQVKQVWFADDATAAGNLEALHQWWTHLSSVGPQFGYFPNAQKTHLVVKPEFENDAKRIFSNTDIQITLEGQRHLGAAIGTRSFADEYVSQKIQNWVSEICALADLANTQPQAAYAAFVHGFIGKLKYIMRTIDDTGPLFKPLEDAIHQKFIPSLTGRDVCSYEERRLLSLPARLGGLNIINPMEIAKSEFEASQSISAPLAEMIVNQTKPNSFERPILQSIKTQVKQSKQQFLEDKTRDVREQSSPHMQRAMDLASEKGASIWLTALPLRDHEFCLNKQEFRDALCFRYGWQLKHVPSHCVCGTSFSIDHAMICPHGAMPAIRHNDIRDMTADWLSETCHDVEKEPPLLPLTGESIQPRSANTQNDARADIRARGFWGRRQCAFFDVRVFHPNAQSYRHSSIQSLYHKHEQIKKREYGNRVREVEYASFTPLVFATSGGMGKEATMFFKRLADILSTKNNDHYSTTLAWIRCKLSFSLIRSAVMCIRGSRSAHHHIPLSTIELSATESRLSLC